MTELFRFNGRLFPDYLKRGNAMQFIAPTAAQFCIGRGLDVGPGRWPLPGARPVEWTDPTSAEDANELPGENHDYIFSSHCLEHLTDPVYALAHWRTKLRPGGVLFLYLPHPDMDYWRPQHCRKHLHLFWPADVARMLSDLGYINVLHGERDLAWSFAVVGFKPRNLREEL